MARLILYGMDKARGDSVCIRTLAGSQMAGVVASVMSIEGRNIWRGEAVTIPGRTESGVDELTPVNLFRNV